MWKWPFFRKVWIHFWSSVFQPSLSWLSKCMEVLSSFVCDNRGTTGVTCWAGAACPSGAPDFPGFYWVRVARSLIVSVVFCRWLFVLLLLVFVLYVLLRCTASDYPFDVFWLPLWCLLITPLISSSFSFWANHSAPSGYN
jgi:hypothetical protein